jgi:hypothetical protein
LAPDLGRAHLFCKEPDAIPFPVSSIVEVADEEAILHQQHEEVLEDQPEGAAGEAAQRIGALAVPPAAIRARGGLRGRGVVRIEEDESAQARQLPDEHPRLPQVVQETRAEHRVEAAELGGLELLDVVVPEVHVRRFEGLEHETGATHVVLAPLQGHHASHTRTAGHLERVIPLVGAQLQDRLHRSQAGRPLEEAVDLVRVPRHASAEGVTAELELKPPGVESLNTRPELRCARVEGHRLTP